MWLPGHEMPKDYVPYPMAAIANELAVLSACPFHRRCHDLTIETTTVRIEFGPPSASQALGCSWLCCHHHNHHQTITRRGSWHLNHLCWDEGLWPIHVLANPQPIHAAKAEEGIRHWQLAADWHPDFPGYGALECKCGPGIHFSVDGGVRAISALLSQHGLEPFESRDIV